MSMASAAFPESGLWMTFEVEGLLHAFRVSRFDGTEGLSELFQFELTLVCDNDAIAFDDVVGATALLTLHNDGAERHVHGIISRFEQGESSGRGARHATYVATLVPHVFRLKLRQTCRVFQQMTVPDIVRAVLDEAGVPSDEVRFQLTRKEHRVREHCIQYRESDWSFVCRLMEEEGIFYFFEHRPDKHVLVIADSPYAHGPIVGAEAVPFRAPTGALRVGEHIARFRFAQEMRPNRVKLRDYDFKKPALVVEGDAHAADKREGLEVYDFSGGYEDPKTVTEFAQVRLEEQQVAGRVGAGDSGCVRLLPGQFFALSEHPREDFNRRYLLTRVAHRGVALDGDDTRSGRGGEGGYSNTFWGIPVEVPFRPSLKTPKPVVRGVQTAVVVGPPGEEIYTDELGRVKARFHWDRSTQRDEQNACWIRVSQIWAGQGWGSMHIPRVGQEVVVDFLEGDLDRPLITGCVYHRTNLPPVNLPAEKTRSTIRSRSTPGGDGFNELAFEDKKGEEEIYLHGQKDWNIEVGNDKDQTVGRDETLAVARNRTKTVGVNQSEGIGLNKTIVVGANHTENIGVEESITVGANSTRTVGANRSETIGANRSVMVGANQSEIIGVNMTLAVGGRKTETVASQSVEQVGEDKELSIDGRYTIEVGGDAESRVEGGSTESVGREKLVRVGKRLEHVCGDSRIIIDERGKIVIEGKDITIRSARPVRILSKRLSVKSTGAVSVKAGGTVKVKGTVVGIN